MKRRDFFAKTGKVLGAGSLLFLTGCARLPFFEEEKEEDIFEREDFEVKEAMFYEKLANKTTRCGVCFRYCTIEPGERGFCRNRENREGKLYNIVYSRPSAVQVDPVEKEPQHHFHPGTKIFCVGTAGCNFRCKYCHNWHLSQKSIDDIGYQYRTPGEIVDGAQENEVSAISFTYNEPTSLYDYMYDTAKLARERGLGVIFHSNGSMNREPLEKLLDYVDSATIDLKGFKESFYRDISQAELSPVLATLKTIANKGVWLEIVNLVVTDLNDDPATIREMCCWIRDELGKDTPLHFTRFMPSYQLTDTTPTPVERLERAHDIAREEGLRFVTVGNVPGHEKNSTFCPGCDHILIKRDHFSVHQINMEEGQCVHCGEKIPGVWR